MPNDWQGQGSLPFGAKPPPTPEPEPAPPKPGERDAPLSVAALVRAAGAAVDRAVGTVWVEGEVSSLSRASSGHLYFVLKDERAQIPAVLWRSDARRLRFRIEDGQRLRCRAKVGIYERDGKFQLYVGFAEPAGLGAEALALEQLRRKLAAEGLFAAERKRPLPRLPRCIGVVTSRSGAALRDIVRVVHRRFPVRIVVAHASVQGADAPREIVWALRGLARQPIDVLIVGRGGGSASDLAAFNHERVVRAIAACPVPTVSAVGHEVDVSLSDMAADHRAATPSQAGEMVVPVLADLAADLDKEERRLHRELSLVLRSARQDVDQIVQIATARIHRRIADERRELARLAQAVARQHPRARLEANRAAMDKLCAQLEAGYRAASQRRSRELAHLAGRLDSLSPLRVLDRGYAIARAGTRVLTAATQVRPGDELSLRLAAGALDCRVERVHDADDASSDE